MSAVWKQFLVQKHEKDIVEPGSNVFFVQTCIVSLGILGVVLWFTFLSLARAADGKWGAAC